MPKIPRWDARDAERALLRAGFTLLRTKGSHRIYGYGSLRVTVPFRGQKATRVQPSKLIALALTSSMICAKSVPAMSAKQRCSTILSLSPLL
ncbi:MAG: type II toxin-antitoxin system HicA family toxin [Acidobacteria bacterium]|nr:type II toxin-antitoxin system HicA family toxin [Acidobacteriota bacterium]